MSTTSPIIQLPDQPPSTTTLTPKQLTSLFPTLHIYLLPAQPLIALLPTQSITHRGLENALRWQELNIRDPGADFNFHLNEVIEVYQVLAFLGNNLNSSLMRYLDSIIQSTISQGLSLEETAHVWSLRKLPFTKPFVELLVRYLASETKRSLELFKSPHLPARLGVDGLLREECAVKLAFLKWVFADKELYEKLEDVEEVGERRQMSRRRSAVAKFVRVLEKIEGEPYELAA